MRSAAPTFPAEFAATFHQTIQHRARRRETRSALDAFRPWSPSTDRGRGSPAPFQLSLQRPRAGRATTETWIGCCLYVASTRAAARPHGGRLGAGPIGMAWPSGDRRSRRTLAAARSEAAPAAAAPERAGGGLTSGQDAVRPPARGRVDAARHRCPPAQVAGRAGHSVAVLLRVYASAWPVRKRAPSAGSVRRPGRSLSRDSTRIRP